MNFPVPWRCLLPQEAVDFVTHDSNAILRQLSDRTGAMIDVSGERDTPRRLSDRIVTISGQVDQKESACLGIVEKLRRLQDILDDEIGFFVIIVPATAVPVIVGAKGATISEVLAGTGAELSIGKENVMGMPDTPIGLEGTALQVTSAVANIHKVVQDMADRGRLLPADFKYRPDKAAVQLASGAGAHLPEVSLPPAEHDIFVGMDPTQNFRTKAKIIVDTGLAGWLIGKGGRTIREMQENSGAFLHVIREEESTPLLRPGERLLEVCGRYERKLEGIQVIMRTADSMPGNAPRETRIIVPAVLAEPLVMDEVSSSYAGCVVERDPAAAYDDEAVVLIAGPVSSRIQAVQNFMARTDRAHIEGLVVAKSLDGEVVGKDGRPRKEIREVCGWVAPPTPQVSNWQRHESHMRDKVQAPDMSDTGHRVLLEQRRLEDQKRQELLEERRQDELRHRQELRIREERERLQQQQEEMQQQQRHQDELRHREESKIREERDRLWQQQEEDRQQQQNRRRLEQQDCAQHMHEQHQQQQTLQNRRLEERTQPEQQPREMMRNQRDQERQEERQSIEMRHEGKQQQEVSYDGAQHFCKPASADATRNVPPFKGQLAAFGAAADAGPAVETMLMSSSPLAHVRGQLHLLLPEDLLLKSLVPSGLLQDVSRRCQVQIEVAAGSAPPRLRLLILTGTLASNAAAAYWLQVGATCYAATAGDACE
eukprot:TRINITY_DN48398_c0_g1_i1.p1 TRINITY_DN48398_c0_g1~~TRINITY_DN48398_c0_g1_i1.p1  ORF type:complete len:711 (+),score=157.14 TRINITY_DN48398_c0_g1_i1:79-2211(+)